MPAPEVSIVIPSYNERQNVALLYHELKTALDSLNKTWEIIYVDDGSTDGTFEEAKKIHANDKRFKIIRFRRNFGQTAALDAGFKAAQGDIIISLDADLQDNPAEIPRFIEKLNEGYDVVCAWRTTRKDTISKYLFSRLASLMRTIVLGPGVHDSGCTFKAYKKEAVQELNLFGEMHRYLSYLLLWKGFKITEIKVSQRQRKFGKTKYGIKRLLKGFLDMLVVKFWMQYSTRPVHLFGGIGVVAGLLGFLMGIWLLIEKFAFRASLSNRPMLLLSVLLIVLGVQFFLFGIITDILIKIYYQKRTNYEIEKIIG